MIRRNPRMIDAGCTPTGEIDQREVVRRFEVTVEREFVAVHRNASQECLSFCPGCGHDVVMISPERAAGAAGIGVRTVYRWIEEKKVNFVEAGAEKVFVCFESVQRAAGFSASSRDISSGDSK